METPKVDQQRAMEVSRLEGVVEGLGRAMLLLKESPAYEVIFAAHAAALEEHRVALDSFVEHVRGELQRTNGLFHESTRLASPILRAAGR